MPQLFFVFRCKVILYKASDRHDIMILAFSLVVAEWRDLRLLDDFFHVLDFDRALAGQISTFLCHKVPDSSDTGRL